MKPQTERFEASFVMVVLWGTKCGQLSLADR